MIRFLPVTAFVLISAFVVTASAQSVPDQPVPTTYPFKIGYGFNCAFLQLKNPDLALPMDCFATEHVKYRGRPAIILAVNWGQSVDIDVVGHKGYAFFVAKPDGTFERLDELKDISLWPGSREHPSRYAFFLRITGVRQFWRTNLDAERIFASELTVNNGVPCIISRLRPPYNGAISQCAGADPTGVIREARGVLSLESAIAAARKALPKKDLRTKPFPSLYSESEPIGRPSTFVVYRAPRNGPSYWAMTYSVGRRHHLIRVFSDLRVEVEPATDADIRKWSADPDSIR